MALGLSFVPAYQTELSPSLASMVNKATGNAVAQQQCHWQFGAENRGSLNRVAVTNALSGALSSTYWDRRVFVAGISTLGAAAVVTMML